MRENAQKWQFSVLGRLSFEGVAGMKNMLGTPGLKSGALARKM